MLNVYRFLISCIEKNLVPPHKIPKPNCCGIFVFDSHEVCLFSANLTSAGIGMKSNTIETLKSAFAQTIHI